MGTCESVVDFGLLLRTRHEGMHYYGICRDDARYVALRSTLHDQFLCSRKHGLKESVSGRIQESAFFLYSRGYSVFASRQHVCVC